MFVIEDERHAEPQGWRALIEGVRIDASLRASGLRLT